MFLALYNLQSHFHLKDKVKGDILDHTIAQDIDNEKYWAPFIRLT